MRPPLNEPDDQELEELVDDEDRDLLGKPDVPDDVKAEITERLDRFRDEEYADEIEDGPPPA
ncbi:MAG TPA: hypothetical protein VK755_15095 [Candidatus Acidoferrales bacterium]|jgi:hypothetical protein|nr:hypothetical protein [Candidatus Acidoferrales bacterium]